MNTPVIVLTVGDIVGLSVGAILCLCAGCYFIWRVLRKLFYMITDPYNKGQEPL